MGVPLSVAVTLGLLFFLSVGLNEQVAEGCSCLAKHPQQLFCASNAVIRAKITGQVTSTQHELTAYRIKIIKTFKHLNKEPIQVIYSPQQFCGIDVYNGEYLISGNVRNGLLIVDLCDLVKRWDHLSSVDKQYLSMYQSGCDCEISPCTGASCLIKKLKKNKCLMRVQDVFYLDDKEALQSICLQSSNGFCSWQKVIVDK